MTEKEFNQMSDDIKDNIKLANECTKTAEKISKVLKFENEGDK